MNDPSYSNTFPKFQRFAIKKCSNSYLHWQVANDLSNKALTKSFCVKFQFKVVYNNDAF